MNRTAYKNQHIKEHYDRIKIDNRLAEEISDIPKLLSHLKMNDLRKFLPDGEKSLHKKMT